MSHTAIHISCKRRFHSRTTEWFADDLRSLPTYAEGVEFKAEGAQVIASPSLHESGRRYGWLDGHAPWEIAVAPLPDHILEDVRNRAPARTATRPPISDGSEPAWYYSRAETVRMVTNLLNKAIRTADLNTPQREHRDPTAYLLGLQLGSLGLSDSEIAAIGALYEKAVRRG